ncbi:hypothetical protein QAD02_000191 [Eretmocerus hayati]|uniref:Uncharacterized protein n=1 Tax=Eretmocerus hayati TaxID=131215 RepID=A0ACC2NCZ4_9HYME|nr:hypothetical protein QAD02_000191 [Eretmocerus hayati]
MISGQTLTTFIILTLYFHSTHGIPIKYNENLKLELVQVIFRHGIRAHLKCEADFMNVNESAIWPYSFGHLTKEGMKQEYEIGQMLRQRYDGYLPALYNQKHVYAYSSVSARTKTSLQLVLSALYPPVGDFVWDSKLNWMPIAIHSSPLDILNRPRSCSKYENLLKELYNSTEFKTVASKYDDTCETLGKIYGRELNLADIFCLDSSIHVQKHLNLPLPDWSSNELSNIVHEVASFYLNTTSYTNELKRVNGGTYARRFVENMNDSNAWKGRKIYLYSSHETNLHPVASFYNFTVPTGIPENGLAIIIEKLSDEKKNQYVKMMMWTGSPKKLKVLKLDECAEICPMEQYLKIVTPLLPSDDDMLCVFKNMSPKSLERIMNSDTALFSVLYAVFVNGNPLNFDGDSELELVQVLFRHGARTQISCEAEVLKLDESSVLPWGFGQLTKEGMRQEYEVGQMLRKRYNRFLPDLYNQKHVYAYSSGTARNKASLELVLSALYPPIDDFVWNSNFGWMPIPINSMPNLLDILNKPRFCPKYVNLFLQSYNSEELQKEASKHDEIREFLRNVHGKSFNFSTVFCAYNSVFVQKNRNLTLPAWCSDEVFQKLEDAANFYLKILSYNSELKRLNGGTYVKKLVENMRDDNEATKERKIYLYSSHDKNMHAFASFHNITLPRIPDYGSAIIVEKLRNKQENEFVRLVLWSGSPKKFEVLHLNGCLEPCPMEEYVKIVTPMLPTDDDMLCLLKNLQPKILETILNSN